MLTSVNTIKEILSRHNAQPSKMMGQNFLIDQTILDAIIKASHIGKEDTVLEVGPGIGTLTRELAQYAKNVIAIEKDRAMIGILKETVHDVSNIEIIQGDVLENTHYKLPTHYKLVANLPYYITSAIIRMFLETKNPPQEMILMVQKEVGQRICAKPPHMSILAASVQFYGDARIISSVSKGCFWPKPNVDSAIIKITPRNNAELYAELRRKKDGVDLFFRIVKAGFLQPRKQLINNLSVALKKEKSQIQDWLLQNNLKPSQRAETLTMQDWVNLTNTYQK